MAAPRIALPGGYYLQLSEIVYDSEGNGSPFYIIEHPELPVYRSGLFSSENAEKFAKAMNEGEVK